MKKMFNHTLNKFAVDFNSKTGSRTRVRIPVAGTRHIGFQPGQKVAVLGTGSVTIVPVENGVKYDHTYTIEKDGAIRVPAYKFGLRTSNLIVTCDKISRSVQVA